MLKVRFRLVHLLLIMALFAMGLTWWFRFVPGGVPVRSGRELDLAIFGPGYFALIDPEGNERYTRIGRFEVSPSGLLAPCPDHISLVGWTLADNIALPIGSAGVQVAIDGTVTANNAGTTVLVGNINLHRFENPHRLEEVMPGVFARSELSGDAIVGQPGLTAFGTLQQGWVEGHDALFQSLMDVLPLASFIALLGLLLMVRSNARALREIRDRLDAEYDSPVVRHPLRKSA